MSKLCYFKRIHIGLIHHINELELVYCSIESIYFSIELFCHSIELVYHRIELVNCSVRGLN